jgi:large subunit ribosomal protein L9
VKIILRKEVENLGTQGEAVTVKDGYARNYLIPRGLAVRATDGAIRAIDTEKKQRAFKIEKERKTAREFAEGIERITLTVHARAGESGKLFGTITTQMIVDGLKTKGYDIDRKHVTVEEPIKTLGNHTVKIKFYSDVFAALNVLVEAESAE